MGTLLKAIFDRADLDQKLQWMNPPSTWFVDAEESVLVVKPRANSDFWQRTHYGFQSDTGSFLYVSLEEDFCMSTRVHLQSKHQYDQAGLMVRISADCWIKTSVEYETEKPSVLGAVVTNSGYSDWSTQEFRGDTVDFQITRERADYLVCWRESEQPWRQLRMCHLHGDNGENPVLCGLYACCPNQEGLVAKFDYLTIEPATE
jgi:regulation of enolase protein 1 (concanavalin A-like superfamily)